ncbi:MAG: peptide deformylase [Cytophagales bacterium]|nr:MAG: peptide deformylase [Cytophagales bacterium]
MIHPITAYGDPVLKKIAQEIIPNTIDVKKLAQEMFDTMQNAKGVGLAAPQIGLSIRMFVADSSPLEDDEEEDTNNDLAKKTDETTPVFKQVFINPTIEEEWGKEWAYEEGCLSIPGIRGEVYRHSNLRIHFFDENWVEHTKEYDGFAARIIQHEYDHIEGVLFIDYLSNLKKQLLKNKLINISKGNTDASYRMKFPLRK